MAFWLMKTEPETYSFGQLLKEKKTNWNNVRNFQARNYLRAAKEGDSVIIYHSGDERSAVGVASVSKGPYPDPDPEKPGDWVQVDLEAKCALERPVPLAEIKSSPDLRGLPLIRQSRLSVMPITEKHYQTLLKMGSGR